MSAMPLMALGSDDEERMTREVSAGKPLTASEVVEKASHQ